MRDHLRPPRTVLACLLACALASTAAAQGKPEAEPQPQSGEPGVLIEFETHPLLMCHYYLKTHGDASTKPGKDSGVDFTGEAKAYFDAIRTISNAAVWRWIEERIAASQGPADLRKATAQLPPSLRSDETRKVVDSLVGALETAFPKYRKTVFAPDLAGLNRVLVGARKRYMRVQQRIGEALMKQMAFEPVGRPIKVYVVVRTGETAIWGATEDHYFTVIGSFGKSPLNLLEAGIHEATKIIDALQPFGSESVLGMVRRDGDQKNKDELDTFLQGLVAFNSGEMIKRFVSHTYVHSDVQSPEVVRKYRPYLSTYEYIWTDYLDGKMTKPQVSKKLIEEYDAVQRLYPGKKEG